MSHFDNNIRLLKARQPELATLLSNLITSRVRISDSVSGHPTASWDSNGTPLALHSRYDPLREAHQRLSSQPHADADYCILLGFGLGYLLDALISEPEAQSRHYFILESKLEILRAAFEARDLSSILSLQHLHFAWPASGPALAEQWRGFFDPVLAEQSCFLTHLPSVSLDPGLFRSAAEMIQSQTFQIFTDINTLVGKAQEFLENFVKNLPMAAKAPGVIHFAGKFPRVPAVIVSAGPSLDKNVHELRGYGDNVLILATDTALKPLLSAGIEPHFVLTGDPSHANYRHLKGAPSREALLVAEATCYPESFTDFSGRTVACTYENSSLRSLSDLLGNKGTLRAWGSVATMALDFALLLQCDPIIFIGQDLAHMDGRIYCSGIYFDEEWFSGIAGPEAWRRKLVELRAGRRTLNMEDIHGNPIESTDKLVSYWNWIMKEICNHPRTRFINATEGGILKDNVAIASLKEALYRHCRNTTGLRAEVHRLFENARAKSLLYPGIDVSILSSEKLDLQNTIRSGLQLCDGSEPVSAVKILKELETIKESIYANSHLAPLLDCLNQMGNVTFLRKRRALCRAKNPDSSLPEIKSCYSEYFLSVREALSKVEKALWQIEANICA